MRRLEWNLTGLPVEAASESIGAAVEGTKRLVLTAEPGAGKSSLAPLMVANHVAGRVVLLQPRRLAARATAARLASLLGQQVGDLVGLTIRGERTVSNNCRVEVVTEAVLTNRLLADPELPGVGALIFDEFHERSLHADLGLGMALEAGTMLRPDLVIVAMSATIATDPLADMMGNAPVVAVPGRTHPVTTVHHDRPARRAWGDDVAAVVRRSLGERAGDALVFVPGRGEVSRVVRALGDIPDVEVLGLHGGTAPDAQRAILNGGSRRRIIVATAIAETSITVPGVTIVVDGGLARRPQFDPNSGLGALETIFVPRFGADQRRGRAGRVEPGICHRMWSVEDERHLAESFEPDIVSGDPMPLALALSRWGDPLAQDLPLLNDPGLHRLEAGQRSLRLLGIVDESGSLTELGRAVARVPAHPRIGAALTRAAGTPGFSDLVQRLAIVEHGVRLASVDIEAATSAERRQAKATADQLRRIPDSPVEPTQYTSLAEHLLTVWPDRVAAARPGRPGRFLLMTGSEVQIDDRDPLSGAPFIVVIQADGSSPAGRVRAAAAVDRTMVLETLKDEITTESRVEWDDQTARVIAARETRLGSIVLHRETVGAPDREQVQRALVVALRRLGTSHLRWTNEATAMLHRLRWLHAEDGEQWPEVSERVLLERLEEWVEVGAARSPGAVTAGRGLLNILDWQQRAAFDAEAPSTLTDPGGRPHPLDYSSGRPVWSVRLQWLFGMDEHPTVGPNRTPVTIELLTPANRPAQTTNDLPGFWRGSYSAVRSDLRGRYPKHAWPEDPLDP